MSEVERLQCGPRRREILGSRRTPDRDLATEPTPLTAAPPGDSTVLLFEPNKTTADPLTAP